MEKGVEKGMISLIYNVLIASGLDILIMNVGVIITMMLRRKQIMLGLYFDDYHPSYEL